MNKRLFSLIIFFVIVLSVPRQKVLAQEAFEFEIRQSYIEFDKFQNPKDVSDFFQSTATFTDFTLFFKTSDMYRFNWKAGIGYTYYAYLDEPYIFPDYSKPTNSNNINIKMGLVVNTQWPIFSYSIMWNNFFYVNKDFHNIVQKRYYSTAEFGLQFSLTDRIKFIMYSPVSIVSQYRGMFSYILDNQTVESFKPFVELLGGGAGISISF